MSSEKPKFKHEPRKKVRMYPSDKQQTVFGEGGAIEENTCSTAVIKPKPIDFTRKVTCPFCLTFDLLTKFLISTKKGYNQGTGHCPSCNLNMKTKTLLSMNKLTPEQYAQYIVDYPPGSFFNKQKDGCGFQTWFDRLKLIKCIQKTNGKIKEVSWSGPFWAEYRRLKPKEDKPTDEQEEQWAGYETSFSKSAATNSTIAQDKIDKEMNIY